MAFNKEEIIARLQPHANKLISYYEHKGVSFVSKDGEFENVIFYNKEKTVKIAWEVFWRFSGICCTHREAGENQVKVIPLDDDMFMNSYMKAIVKMNFFPKEKE